MNPATPKKHVTARLRSILLICRNATSRPISLNLEGRDSQGLMLLHALIDVQRRSWNNNHVLLWRRYHVKVPDEIKQSISRLTIDRLRPN
jgi:hypothetical protein